MGKKKCPECEQCLPAWLAAFGDLMSLLLCFFVLLLSMSTMDAKKISEAIGSLSGAMSVLEGGNQVEVSKKRIQKATPIEVQEETTETVNRVKQAVSDSNEMLDRKQQASITLEEAQDGFTIELPATLLFKQGSAIIENEDTLLFLKRMALLIGEMPNDVKVSVQGHTDNTPPGNKSIFKDNWELSTARSLAVLKELLLDGVKPNKISASGYGEFSPIASNATSNGRAKNNRVELRFFGDKSDQKPAVETSVLEKVTTP